MEKNRFSKFTPIFFRLIPIIIGVVFIIVVGFTIINQNEKEEIISFETLTKAIKSKRISQEGMLEIAHAIFKDSIITVQDESYHIVGDDKVGFDAANNSPIREKKVTIDTVDVDGNGEIVTLSVVRFLGLACTSCMTEFYITLLGFNGAVYDVRSEKRYTGHDDSLFVSDLAIEEIQLLDVNADNRMEILMRYQADEYLDPEKTKVAILQRQGDNFKVIWQAASHLNMDNDGRYEKKDKSNFDATFSFEKKQEEYPRIVVDRNISKRNGIALDPPAKEQLIYIWDKETRSYHLVGEQNK